MSSDIYGHLQIFMGIRGCWPRSNQIFTLQMAYTASLPVPPGTHEAHRFPQSLTWQDRISAGYLGAGLAAWEHCPRGEE